MGRSPTDREPNQWHQPTNTKQITLTPSGYLTLCGSLSSHVADCSDGLVWSRHQDGYDEILVRPTFIGESTRGVYKLTATDGVISINVNEGIVDPLAVSWPVDDSVELPAEIVETGDIIARRPADD